MESAVKEAEREPFDPVDPNESPEDAESRQALAQEQEYAKQVENDLGLADEIDPDEDNEDDTAY